MELVEARALPGAERVLAMVAEDADAAAAAFCSVVGFGVNFLTTKESQKKMNPTTMMTAIIKFELFFIVHRIETAAAKRMATSESLESHPKAFPRALLLKRLFHISGTAGNKPAAGAHIRRNGFLVYRHQYNKEELHALSEKMVLQITTPRIDGNKNEGEGIRRERRAVRPTAFFAFSGAVILKLSVRQRFSCALEIQFFFFRGQRGERDKN